MARLGGAITVIASEATRSRGTQGATPGRRVASLLAMTIPRERNMLRRVGGLRGEPDKDVAHEPRHDGLARGRPGARHPYAADFRPAVLGGAISASAGMPHSRLSFHAIRIVSRRLPVKMSDAR
jgi:hypothetical protein